MPYRTLRVSLDSRGILIVSLNRPEVRNAFNEVVMDELAHAFTVEATQEGVRVIILKGEGATFCAGGDLNWMKKAVNFSFEENLADTRKLSQLFETLNECPKPVIGLVQGAAIGGGVGLVSICDLVIAVSDAQFSLSEVRLGIVPSCIGPFVISKIGASHARRLFISGERFRAEKAREIGLVHEVVADVPALNDALEQKLESMLQCAPQAMAAAKRLVLDLSWPEKRLQISDPLEYTAQTLAELRISKEGQEGVRAFLEKRPPSWLSKVAGDLQ